MLQFEREQEMLQKWADFVREVDPDMVIGYNTTNFDFPYLLDRAKALKVQGFPYLGRLLSKSNPLVAPSMLEKHLTQTPSFHRHQDRGQGCPFLVKSLRISRLEDDQPGRPTSAGSAHGHAARL